MLGALSCEPFIAAIFTSGGFEVAYLICSDARDFTFTDTDLA
jgi:hypothetical protein